MKDMNISRHQQPSVTSSPKKMDDFTSCQKQIDLVRGLNNRGAACLVAGDPKGAIARFTMALKICRKLLAHLDGSNDLDLLTDRKNGATTMSLDQLVRNEGKQEPNVVIENAHIYPRPIVLPRKLTGRFCKLLAHVLIFNQALAYQIYGQSSRVVLALQKAVKLFETGLRSVLDDNLMSTSTHYILACLNSMGMIYRKLNNLKSAEQCFERLLSTMLFLLHTEHCLASELNMKFVPAVAHLIFKTKRTATAAAA